MVIPIAPQTIDQITQVLVESMQPEQIFLFGSYAWGTPDLDSDLDFLVVVTDSHLTPTRRSVQARQLLRHFNLPKDLLIMTRAEFDTYKALPSSLSFQIAQKGKLLYDGRSKTSIGAQLAHTG